MMAYQPPDEVGESHQYLSDAKKVLTRYSYGSKLKGDTSDVITQDYLDAQRQYKNNIHYQFQKGRLPAGMPDLNPNSTAFDWAVQKNMAIGPYAIQLPQPEKPYIGYNFPGTWGQFNNGFGWDVLVRLNNERFDKQGLGYNTTAFLQGTQDHSYLDMVNEGAGEFLRMALPNRQKKLLFGYSGGAGALVEALYRWPAERRGEIVMVGQFGDPNRPPGKTLLGNDPGGHGISEDFPPDWILPRYFSFTLPGDMYPNADGLLFIFYDILVRLEATPEFALWFFNLIVDQLGNLTPIGSLILGAGSPLAPLLPMLTGGSGTKINLISMIFNIPAIVISISKLLQFLITQDHSHYGDKPEFGGLTAVDRCAQIANALP